MTTYIIGDVHGCFDSLQDLLSKINYQQGKDDLWFTGDLINRGPKNIEVLNFIYNENNSRVILGNHDLHFLALEANVGNKHYNGLSDVINHKNCKKWAEWLRSMPLIYSENNISMVHAGIYPGWTINMARQLSAEVCEVLMSNDYTDLLENMYGNQPNMWNEKLTGWPRVRFIINAFVRMRYLTYDGKCDFEHNMAPKDKPDHLTPWYDHPNSSIEDNHTVTFGHWAALEASVSKNNIYALDGGCVWGKKLVAFCTTTKNKISIPASDSRNNSSCF